MAEDANIVLTPDEVRTLERWLAEWKWQRARLLPPNIATIIAKLCDQFWATLNAKEK